jgi:hypothetical protein
MVQISATPRPNVPDGVPGDPLEPGEFNYLSFTFRIILAAGESVTAINLEENPPGTIIPMFAAPNNDMFQLHPNGDDTTFNDENVNIPGAFPGLTGADDSQYNFSENDFVFGVPVADTNGDLSAVMVAPDDPLNADFDLAHVVIPDTSFGNYNIVLTVEGGPSPGVQTLSGIFTAVPEASQVLAGSVLTMGVLGVYIVRRRLSKRAVTA